MLPFCTIPRCWIFLGAGSRYRHGQTLLKPPKHWPMLATGFEHSIFSNNSAFFFVFDKFRQLPRLHRQRYWPGILHCTMAGWKQFFRLFWKSVHGQLPDGNRIRWNHRMIFSIQFLSGRHICWSAWNNDPVQVGNSVENWPHYVTHSVAWARGGIGGCW